MKKVLLVLLLASFAWSKDAMKVTVAATHAVTHEDRGGRAVIDKAIMGAHAPTGQSESFNLDAIVNGQHVFLACDDSKGCEARAGNLRRRIEARKMDQNDFHHSSHKQECKPLVQNRR